MIHALRDVVGRPFALMLTLGNVADITATPELLAHMGRALTRFANSASMQLIDTR
jgi:hypothetical protein